MKNCCGHTKVRQQETNRKVISETYECAFQDICHGNTPPSSQYEPIPCNLVHKKLYQKEHGAKIASANQDKWRDIASLVCRIKMILVCFFPGHLYHKNPHIRAPFDAQKLMSKSGSGLLCEDLTFGIKVESQE